MLSKTAVECPQRLLAMTQALAPVRTAVVGAGTPLVLAGVRAAVEHEIVEPVLIGEHREIVRAAQKIDWPVADFEIVAAADEASAALAGAGLARNGRVDMVLKGHIHSDTFMHPLVARDSGIRNQRRLSHVFHMTIAGNDQPLLITDGAINVAPDVEGRVAIVENAVDLAHALGCQRPKVALLAASEEITEAMPVTLECREIAERCSASGIAADVWGPLALDNIVSVSAARLKGINHPVAGQANIIVVPTIEVGNALFKMMVYFLGACAAGIVVGGNVPVLLTSRADPPPARLASTALGAILAQAQLAA
ncbi:MAG: bifunctional enoyl-CoA hydratase/phosphate acetyltransferase [Arenicellales bacterium]|jgi:phosphate acetyltransferase|nr:bifunctional enoyl-CoA hydratase/phosphate acetyltransferase [Arenicellales bacterium]